MKIVILYGQPNKEASNDELDTMTQVEVVSQGLVNLGHHPIPLALSLDSQNAISELRFIGPELVFNLVEAIGGQGRLIYVGPALLDTLRMPYTGAKTEAIFLTSNKVMGKRLLRSAGIPTPDWFVSQDLKDGIPLRGGRYIAKSVWEHASIGLSQEAVIDVREKHELLTLLERRQGQLANEGFIESYVDGREFNLSLLAGSEGPEVLPPAEIRFDAFPEGKLRIVDYRAKWEEESFEYANTPRNFSFRDEDESLLQELNRLAIACWRLFDLRGYARVDFRVDSIGNPWVLEVNANPCLSPDAGFMAAARHAGLSANDVLQRILQEVE